MARERMGYCPAPVIGRGTDDALNFWTANVTATVVSRGWPNEDRNVKDSGGSVDVLLLAPRGEESMLPSWLGGELLDSDQPKCFNPSAPAIGHSCHDPHETGCFPRPLGCLRRRVRSGAQLTSSSSSFLHETRNMEGRWQV
jgi:hypothetical protein